MKIEKHNKNMDGLLRVLNWCFERRNYLEWNPRIDASK